MGQGQLALYSLVRSESLRQLSNIRSGAIDFAGARKSVMRLLQLSSNPLLALRAITSDIRSEEHTSELQSLMRISYAVFCLKKKNKLRKNKTSRTTANQHKTVTHLTNSRKLLTG